MLGAFAVVGVAVGVSSRSADNYPPAPPSGGRASVFASDSDPAGNGHGTVELDRARNGHFFATLNINGTPVKFLVDTGAYKVMLSPQDAARVGLPGGEYTGSAMGVGGEVRIRDVTLDKVELGPIRLSQVGAVVPEQPQDISLLGQNFLARLHTVEIRGDTMVLSN